MRLSRFSGDYIQSKSARALPNHVEIKFANGNTVRVAKSALIPKGSKSLRWEELSVGYYGLFIIVPGEPNVNISAEDIRSLTDREFRNYIRNRRNRPK